MLIRSSMDDGQDLINCIHFSRNLESRLLAVHSPQNFSLFLIAENREITSQGRTMPSGISVASVVRFFVFFGVSAAYFMFFA